MKNVLLVLCALPLAACSRSDKPAEEQTAVMGTLGKTDEEFLTQIRGAVITAYFTSEEVCKNVTHYDPVPGAYVVCAPTSEIGNVIMSEPR